MNYRYNRGPGYTSNTDGTMTLEDALAYAKKNRLSCRVYEDTRKGEDLGRFHIIVSGFEHYDKVYKHRANVTWEMQVEHV